jgi:4a-hydroxytetrahydrobiopterin dehydratase
MYHLDSFSSVIEFMKFAAEILDKNQHHPRWENQYKSLTVYFSTWDAGCKVTEYDFAAAETLDRLFASFKTGERGDRV